MSAPVTRHGENGTARRRGSTRQLQLGFAVGVLLLIASSVVLLVLTRQAAALHLLVTSIGGVHAWTVLTRSPRLIATVRLVAAVAASAGLLVTVGAVASVLEVGSPEDAAYLGLISLFFLATNVADLRGRQVGD